MHFLFQIFSSSYRIFCEFFCSNVRYEVLSIVRFFKLERGKHDLVLLHVVVGSNSFHEGNNSTKIQLQIQFHHIYIVTHVADVFSHSGDIFLQFNDVRLIR